MPAELTVALGLIWGHLNTYQFEDAYYLAHACRQIWPQETRLVLMFAYAAVELLEPLDDATRTVLDHAECKEWTELIRRRAEYLDRNGAAPQPGAVQQYVQ
jgi:hypothetical protein